jgi:hypothetical protein
LYIKRESVCINRRLSNSYTLQTNKRGLAPQSGGVAPKRSNRDKKNGENNKNYLYFILFKKTADAFLPS